MSVRKQVAAALRDNLDSKTYRVLDVEDMPDTISRRTVIVRFHEWTPAPNGMWGLDAGFIITAASPHQDLSKAEDDLDDIAADLMAAFKATPHLTWTRGRKVMLGGLYPALDFEINQPTNPLA